MNATIKPQAPSGRSLERLVRRLDLWMLRFYVVTWRGRCTAANYNQPPWPRPLAYLRWRFWHTTLWMQPAWDWLNVRVMMLADRLKHPPNAKVSDGSQPPMTFDLSLSESAGSRSLHRLVRLLT